MSLVDRRAPRLRSKTMNLFSVNSVRFLRENVYSGDLLLSMSAKNIENGFRFIINGMHEL